MKRSTTGFTLIELVIAIAIIGILVAVALPSYQEQVRKTRRNDTQASLVELGTAMERYFSRNNTYAGATLGAGGIYPSQTPIDATTKHYNLSIPTATAAAYTVRAVPINGQVGDGRLELDSNGTRRWNSLDDGTGTNHGW